MGKSSMGSSSGGGGGGGGGGGNSASNRKRKYYNARGQGGGSCGPGNSCGPKLQGHITSNKKWNKNPKRGGPGMLLTCETGRERKCQNEGIDILMHYYYYLSDGRTLSGGNAGKDVDDDDNDDDDDGKDGNGGSLTLEEELKKLKSKNAKALSSKSDRSFTTANDAFGVYETGCRGSVFVLCTIPNCRLIPPIQTEYMLAKNNDQKHTTTQQSPAADSSDDEDHDEGGNPRREDDNDVGGVEDGTDMDSSSKEATKKRRIGDNGDDEVKDKGKTTTLVTKSKKLSTTTAAARSSLSTTTKDDAVTERGSNTIRSNPIIWDPIASVKTILADLDRKSKMAPSSRFVTRMIPLQATCFASVEELRLTAIELFRLYLPASTKTFAIIPRRRHCDSLTRDQIITTIGDIVLDMVPTCKVQLNNPDATIVVEICRNICGISVVSDYDSYRNFNLFTAKEE